MVGSASAGAHRLRVAEGCAALWSFWTRGIASSSERPARGPSRVGRHEVIRAMLCSEVYICCVDCEFTEVLDLAPGLGKSARRDWNGYGTQ